MNLSRLLARCPRGLPHISLTRQVGYSRAYTYVARGTQQNERGEEFLIKRLVAAHPARKDRPDWKHFPEVVDGVLVVNVKDKHAVKRFPVPGRWLRDNCACAGCRNPDTAQRRINVLKDPKAGKVVGAESDVSGQTFQVTFADGHRSTIPRSLIDDSRTQRTTRLRAGDRDKMEFWQADIASSEPIVEYEAVKQSTGMADLMAMIRKFGFCFVDNMPATPEATQALLEQIGPIRNTHYGGFYDFTSDLSSKDTAYTSEALEPHTDTTYFTDPIGLQALHLLSHTDGEGGLSSLVDGFGVANELFQKDSSAYATLSEAGIYGHASGNEGINIQPAHAFPVLNHSPEGGGLFQVRWNTADRAGFRLQMKNIDRWYDAAAQFDALLSDPKNVYWFQLKPGRMLLFDNWRVLHGRSAFTGKRRMCGGYINRDDYISKYRMTNYTKEEIDASTVTG